MAEADAKLHEAIGFFEQMLQSMPGDRTSLEFLSVAYQQTGQGEKRRDCLIRLADCLLFEKDFEKAQSIAGYLSEYADHPQAREAVERVVEQMQGHLVQSDIHRAAQALGGGTATPDGATAAGAFQNLAGEVHALSHSAAAAEMDLVWFWKEREFLTKEVCMDVLHILTELPVTDLPLLISALALVDEQHPELTEALMEAMQRASDMPPIPIDLFELQPAAAQLLSPAFVQVKGALPFALLGNEVLVALLNPQSKELRDEVEARIGRPCHFFFAHPKAWLKAAAKSGV